MTVARPLEAAAPDAHVPAIANAPSAIVMPWDDIQSRTKRTPAPSPAG